MNERIKELAGQALDQAVPETWSTLTQEQLVRFQDKFAELIVRQCAEVADLADENSCEWIGGNILTHFGVE